MLLLQQLMKFGHFLTYLTAINGIWSVPRYSYSNYWNLEFGPPIPPTAIDGESFNGPGMFMAVIHAAVSWA